MREILFKDSKQAEGQYRKTNAVLPCNIGDVVYYLSGHKHFYITEHEVVGFCIGIEGLRIDLGDFKTFYPNERLFFTRKAAIKELNRRTINDEK